MGFYWNILAKETLDNINGEDILRQHVRRMSDKLANVVIGFVENTGKRLVVC
jgi:hypothetical protein